MWHVLYGPPNDRQSRTLSPWTRRQRLQQLKSTFLTGLAMKRWHLEINKPAMLSERLDNPHLFSDADSHLWNCLVRFQGLLYWFTELCVVEVWQSTTRWSFHENKTNYWPQNIPLQLLQPFSSTETTCVTADHVAPNKFPIYRAIIYHLSCDNLSFIVR